MAESVLQAIKQGYWDFEPRDAPAGDFPATGAMPGTKDKLQVLAERVRQGLPLWHPSDRVDSEESPDNFLAN